MVIGKVFGNDKILLCVIKDCFFVIFLMFMFIVNNLFISGVFLFMWKVVEVIFIYK